MAYTDKYLKELSQYKPELTKHDDFDAFWQDTLEASARAPLNPSMAQYDYPSPNATVYDIAYDGFDGTRIHGWYIVPSFSQKEKHPCLVHYHGFTGSRGTPADFMAWLMLGVAVVSVDVRGQCGSTGDRQAYTSGTVQSVITHGILDKSEYYFRYVYMDCVRAGLRMRAKASGCVQAHRGGRQPRRRAHDGRGGAGRAPVPGAGGCAVQQQPAGARGE